MNLYGESILRAGPSWLGYRFHIPIIWHPTPGYQALYEMPERQTGQFFDYLVNHHGCRPPHEIPSPAYSLTALHVNYNIFMRSWNRVSRGVCGVLKMYVFDDHFNGFSIELVELFASWTWKTIKNYKETRDINMQDLTTNNCHSLMQEGVKTRSCCSKGKDKDEVTTVPLTGDRMQTRLSRSKQIGPEKEEKTPDRRRREKRWLRINGSANPSGSLILRDHCFI